MSSENISRPIYFKSEEDDWSDEETDGKWTKIGIEMPHFNH